MRRAAARAAAAAGARLVAVGATPVREAHRTVPDEPRYHDMSRRFGPVAHDPAVCGCHVHVGVPDRELAVQVCNHLRPWLPVVQALTTNSPLHDGRDTGHASWRSMQLERWPSIGPTPHFDSAADYDATVRDLIATGIMLDAAMVYWYARPSASYPTVEVRVGDVCPTVDDTVLVAGLVRALVATMIDEVRAGRPAPRIRDCLVAAAHWRAAHDGVDGDLVDLRTGRPRPAWDLIDDLLVSLAPALRRHGDLDLVRREADRLRRDGTGATRQRRIMADTGGDVRAVLAHLAARTTAPGPPRRGLSAARRRGRSPGRRAGGVPDADERLDAHQLGEPLLPHLEEEDVLALAGVRGQGVELLTAELAGVHPGGDLLVGEADLGISAASAGPGSNSAELAHDLAEPLHQRARHRRPVHLRCRPVISTAAIVMRCAWMWSGWP